MTIHHRTLPALSIIGAAVALTTGCSGGREAAPVTTAPVALPTEISIPGTGVFPESLSAAADGSIYIGSVGKAEVYRVSPGGNLAEPFIAPGTGGLRQAFGVLADDAAGVLWVCSNQMGAPGDAPAQPGDLMAFELASGAYRSSHAFPEGGMCNDIAVGPQGDVYATDTTGMQILRLPNGGQALEVWAGDGAFGPPGGVLDGIAVVAGRVIVNTLLTSKLFAVDMDADGRAGMVTELKLSAPLSMPDGMRAHGSDGLLTTDGTGKIQHVVIRGSEADVHTVKDGLEGPVSVTVVPGTKQGYALEGQLAIMMARPDGPPAPAEQPYRAVGFVLP